MYVIAIGHSSGGMITVHFNNCTYYRISAEKWVHKDTKQSQSPQGAKILEKAYQKASSHINERKW